MASFAFQTALYTGDNPRIFGQAGVLHVFVVGFFRARSGIQDVGDQSVSVVGCCTK